MEKGGNRPKRKLTPQQRERRRKRQAARRRKRRLMLLGICTLNALLLGGLFWLIFSLTAQNARAAEAFSPSPSLPLETPSPSPVPAAVPSMPAPAIKEDWYEERNRQLYTHMRPMETIRTMLLSTGVSMRCR